MQLLVKHQHPTRSLLLKLKYLQVTHISLCCIHGVITIMSFAFLTSIVPCRIFWLDIWFCNCIFCSCVYLMNATYENLLVVVM